MGTPRTAATQTPTKRDGWFWLAGSLWAIALVLTVGVVVTTLAGPDPTAGAVLLTLAGVVGPLALVTVGAILGWLRPRNPVGWLLLADGLVWVVGVVHERYVDPDNLRPGADVAAAFFDRAGWVLGLGLIALALLVFPTGHPPTRRWRLVGWMIVGGGGVLAVAGLLIPGELPSWPISNPFGVEALSRLATVAADVAGPVFFIGLNGALISVVVRFRRATGVERQQVRWLAFVVGLVLAGFAIGQLLTAIGLPGESWLNTLPLMFAVPIAVAVAVLRYRLWDLDIVVDRTLTYGVVAVLITAIYVLVIAGLGALVGGNARSEVWLAVLATGIAAAIFQPAREAAQLGVRRLLFRGKEGELPKVRVRTMGGFRVELSGRPVSASDWQSKKARQLLKILIARRGRPVHREELMELLWSGEPTDGVKKRLAVAASTLRAVLDPDRTHPGDYYLKGDADALQLDLDHVEVDVEEFMSTAESALRDGGPGLEIAEAEYLGDFLEEDRYEEWAQPLRDEARAAYLAVLRARAGIEQKRNPDVAVTTLLKVIEVDPWDESAHLAIVSTLRDAGRHGEARRAHRYYTSRMEELGVEPASL